MTNEHLKNFIRNMEIVRFLKDHSQREASVKAGLKNEGRWERLVSGRHPMKFDDMAAICRYTDKTIDQMMYGKAKIEITIEQA